MIKQFILCCPLCGSDNKLVEQKQGEFICKNCFNEWLASDLNYSLKEINLQTYIKISQEEYKND